MSQTLNIDEVQYEWQKKGELNEQDRTVFIEAFSNAYQKLTPEQLGLNISIEDFLDETFAREAEKFTSQDNISIVRAFFKESLIGFAIFEKTYSSVYVRQIFVVHDYARQGIGSQLVAHCHDFIEEVENIELVLHQHNQVAIQFCKNYGFEPIQETDAYKNYGLEPKYYMKYRLNWKDNLRKQIKALDTCTDLFVEPIGLMTTIHVEFSIDVELSEGQERPPSLQVLRFVDNVGDFLFEELDCQYLGEHGDETNFRT